MDFQYQSSRGHSRGRGGGGASRRRQSPGSEGRWTHDRAGWQDSHPGPSRGPNRSQSPRGFANQSQGEDRSQRSNDQQNRASRSFEIRGRSSQRVNQRGRVQPGRHAGEGRGRGGQGRDDTPAHGPRGRGHPRRRRLASHVNNRSQHLQQSPSRNRRNHQSAPHLNQPNFAGPERGGLNSKQPSRRASLASNQPQFDENLNVAFDTPKHKRNYVVTTSLGTDHVGRDRFRDAAEFINQPPGRILTPYELDTCVTLVYDFKYGFDKDRLVSPEQWVIDSQELALTVTAAKNSTWKDFSTLQAAQGRASLMLETTKLDAFLNGINDILHKGDAFALRDWLAVDPPFNDEYTAISVRVRNMPKDFNLIDYCREVLREVYTREWNGFIPFIFQYLLFLRDINMENMLEAYDMLKELLAKAITALGHPTSGLLILPTVVRYSQLLSRFAIRLERSPELTAKLPGSVGDEPSESLPELTANIIRQAFVTCLNDRSDPTNTAEYSRKFGIYQLANVCLKILFACKKTSSAEQIFTNVYNLAPPLSLYPRSEQVTYLYYLGRFCWANGHWYRASLALQTAYDNSYRFAIKQRRLILIYLIASNMILGRFPSQDLYARPEAEGLKNLFHPICRSIQKGNLEMFLRLTATNGPYARWFIKFRILLQIRNRCEVLVWRSLARTAFLLSGNIPENPKSAPTLNLQDFHALYTLLQVRARVPFELLGFLPQDQRHHDWMWDDKFVEYMNMNVDASFWDDQDLDWSIVLPDVMEAESIFSSLIGQGLLGGYLSHRLLRFAIQGAKSKGGPLQAGFPNVWRTLTEGEDDEVPGWKKAGRGPAGGGRVVNLTDARPVGVAP